MAHGARFHGPFCRARSSATLVLPPDYPFGSKLLLEERQMIGIILIILLIVFLAGGFSGRFGGYGYGYGHRSMGGLGIILIIVIALLLFRVL
jgi:hypothetical protein